MRQKVIRNLRNIKISGEMGTGDWEEEGGKMCMLKSVEESNCCWLLGCVW